jgi:RecB family exonuclease
MTLKPKSFSASAFQVAETCMARYYAENILRSERPPNLAADLGTAVHAALEWYVKAVYIEKAKPASLQALLMLYRMQFCAIFNTVEPDAHDWYEEGRDMLTVWFNRTDFEDREVISCETKTNFLIKTSIGEIPFNYIWDRFDKLIGRDEEYEVVDYKTIRRRLTPNDLRAKIQARFYGLAAQIQVPTAKKVWVRFDLLRHDSVATVFTKADNIATWNFAKALAEKIISTPEPGSVLPSGETAPWPETLNAECNFCVRKASCNAIRSNVVGGGLWSLDTIEKRVEAKAKLDFQRKAISALLDDLDEVILKELAEEHGVTELPVGEYVAKVKQSSRQSVDAERVEKVVGNEIFLKYGGVSLTMANYKKMLKDPALTPQQKAQLQSLVYRSAGELRLEVTPKNPIDDE